MSGTPLLVFADDWGRHPSSCQHLIRRLLPRHPTLWVNTIGMRTPRIDLATFRRGLGKVRQWLAPAAPAGQVRPTNLRVANPRMWPWLTRPSDRWINRRLLRRALLRMVRGLPESPVALTTIPVVSVVMDDLPVRRWVYYCVDDFGHWPGLDQSALRLMEEDLVRRADVVVCVSETLRDRLAGMGRSSYLLTHGVDLDFWQAAPRPDDMSPLRDLERPLVLFWGVVDRRMDADILRSLAGRLERGTLVLAGPEDNPDPALRSLPRLAFLGPQPFEHLPALAHEAAVLVMPYADLPVTRAMQPLKLKEYLATGQPVVVRDLPSTRSWADALDTADSPDAFADAVLRRLREGISPAQRQARQRLAEESWDGKARRLEQWILADMCPSSGARLSGVAHDA